MTVEAPDSPQHRPPAMIRRTARANDEPAPDVLVLLSGGLDSAALLAHYRGRRGGIRALHVDYGQPARTSEWAAARRIAAHYRVPIERVEAGVGVALSDGEFSARNALLVMLAASTLPHASQLVALGIHAGTSYYDCTPAFVADLQRILDGYFRGVVQLDAPFLNATKLDIYAVCRARRVPMRLTYSCETRSRRPCGECRSCLDRRRLGLR